MTASPRPARRVRTFGRARDMTRGVRLMQFALARLYGAGWPATVARGVGLQPDARLRTHTLRLPSRAASALALHVAFASDLHAGPTTHPDVLLLADIPAPLGRFAVLGNHDLMGDDRYVAERLVSRGVGCSTIPVRLFARAEVHLCTLVGGGD